MEQASALEVIAAARRSVVEGPPGSGKTLVAAALAAMTRRAGEVVVLTPRAPLAACLGAALSRMGVTTSTVHRVAMRLMASRGRLRYRPTYDDEEFFMEAASLVEPGTFEAVIVDEGQEVPPSQWRFIEALAGDRPLVEFRDESRRLEAPPHDHGNGALLVRLQERWRSPPRIAELDELITAQRPCPSAVGRLHTVRAFAARPDNVDRAIIAALTVARRYGVPLSDIGIVSLVPSDSGSVQLINRWTKNGKRLSRSFQEKPRSDSMVADGFAAWAGLERRAVIVVDVLPGIRHRATKLHIAVSRAREFLALVVLRDHLAGDPVLASWFGDALTRCE